MKKLFALLLAAALLLCVTACADSDAPATGTPATGTPATEAPTAETPATETTTTKVLPTVLDQNEYVLYQNVFFNDAADDYVGKAATKEGVFTRVTDAFSDVTRYYVWGYMDATKCCDWQWEFVPKDPDSLPANGSLVKMTGTMARDDAALDGIWFTDAEVAVKTVFEGPACEVDMTTMDATLERVQLLNMQYKPDSFRGKTLRLYGRVFSLTAIQHPYYDGAWTQELATETELPAIGTMVVVTGTWQGDRIQTEKIDPTSDY